MSKDKDDRNDNDYSHNIIIAGAGLAGLATSLGLAKLGYTVELMERRYDWASQGSAFGLAPSGRKALMELLAESALSSDSDKDQASNTTNSTTIATNNDDTQDVVESELLPKGIYFQEHDSHLFGWWMVRDFLLDQVTKHSNKITLSMGWTLEDIDDRSDSTCIQVTFNKTQRGPQEQETSSTTADDCHVCTKKGVMLIAADGVYSKTRELLQLEPSKRTDKVLWRGALNLIPPGSVLEPIMLPPEDNDGTSSTNRNPNVEPLRTNEATSGLTQGNCILSLFNFHAKQPRQMTFVLSVDLEKTNAEMPATGTHPRTYFDKEISNPYHLEILEEVYRLAEKEDLEWPLARSVIVLPKDNDKGWGGQGRVTLIGDAAHAMRPASGLGGSMAFEDAVVLVRLLRQKRQEQQAALESSTTSKVSILDTRESTEQIIHEFEASRMDRVRRIWQDQWNISEKAYSKNKKDRDLLNWTPEFRKWVQDGV